ncbi:hypothetical protein M408DRAFT_22609 [Serendipita vermifera MAFF 305830]|uniref:Uncharacterized protein n=1 Tax=Serendipita vermifera MAFF 305830 TaxID=933852 RepID=A0A0C3BCA9_SERVB|nr:hypothetical protein M408DRAFT_22609 [Serendipita vermifera MAFF 305830]
MTQIHSRHAAYKSAYKLDIDGVSNRSLPTYDSDNLSINPLAQGIPDSYILVPIQQQDISYVDIINRVITIKYKFFIIKIICWQSADGKFHNRHSIFEELADADLSPEAAPQPLRPATPHPVPQAPNHFQAPIEAEAPLQRPPLENFNRPSHRQYF